MLYPHVTYHISSYTARHVTYRHIILYLMAHIISRHATTHRVIMSYRMSYLVISSVVISQLHMSPCHIIMPYIIISPHIPYIPPCITYIIVAHISSYISKDHTSSYHVIMSYPFIIYFLIMSRHIYHHILYHISTHTIYYPIFHQIISHRIIAYHVMSYLCHVISYYHYHYN